LLEEPDRFQRYILEVDLTVDEWLRQRKIFHSPTECDLFELGFATFFLNRTNHSGVLNGGMIGGRAQMSKWNLDARFNRRELAARVKRIARNSSKIMLLNLDAGELIGGLERIISESRVLVYIDPPYYRKGRDLYYDFYKPEDHARLSNAISLLNKDVRWVVSYDNEPEIVSLYSKYAAVEYNLSYSVRNGRVGKEVMFFSDSIVPPHTHTLGEEISDGSNPPSKRLSASA
jgi:DNA adenine methylase